MSMLDENCFEGLRCAETHTLSHENVQNRNMSLVMLVSASRDPLRNVSPSTLSRLCPRPRPLFFHLHDPTSALNLNYVGFDHHCFHSWNMVLWGDIFGNAPIHPEDAFKTRPRRPRAKRPKPHVFPVPTQAPAAAAQAAPGLQGMRPPANIPLRPPAPGRSVPLRAPAPASQFVPSPSTWQPAPASHSLPSYRLPSQSLPQPAAFRSTLHQQAPASYVAAEATTNAPAHQPPAKQIQRKQNKPNFLSFSDDNIQSIKQRDHRVGGLNVASAANAGMDNLPPVEGTHATDFTFFPPSSSDGGFVFPGQCNFSESSRGPE